MGKKYKFKERELKDIFSKVYEAVRVVYEINGLSAKTHADFYSFNNLEEYLNILTSCPIKFFSEDQALHLKKARKTLEEAIKIQEGKFNEIRE